ncbi:MAG TPA: hypothetical protein PLM75_00160 [bacterium]|nr:hypothetical protein [bacterium]HPP86258.1 hypothetical protein [bacterium]
MKILSWLWETWKKIGEFIGHIMSTVLLSLIYILIVTPFAVSYKIFNKHFFRFNREYQTYWVNRKIVDQTLENYKKQY